MAVSPRRGPAEWLVVLCGVWCLGLGLYFIFLRPPLLPEDARYMGADLQSLQAAAPRLATWLGKVFTVMGGFMAGTGVLITYFGWKVLATRPPWATLVLVLVGAITVALMSVVNFTLNSDFRWLLLAPPVVWATALALYEVRRSRSEP